MIRRYWGLTLEEVTDDIVNFVHAYWTSCVLSSLVRLCAVSANALVTPGRQGRQSRLNEDRCKSSRVCVCESRCLRIHQAEDTHWLISSWVAGRCRRCFLNVQEINFDFDCHPSIRRDIFTKGHKKICGMSKRCQLNHFIFMQLLFQTYAKNRDLLSCRMTRPYFWSC